MKPKNADMSQIRADSRRFSQIFADFRRFSQILKKMEKIEPFGAKFSNDY